MSDYVRGDILVCTKNGHHWYGDRFEFVRYTKRSSNRGILADMNNKCYTVDLNSYSILTPTHPR